MLLSIGACSLPESVIVARTMAVAKPMSPMMAPMTRKTRPLAMRMRERLGVTSRVAVMVMCRYSPVIATMPRMSTNSADEPAAPTMLSMYSGFMRSWSLFSAPIALGVR